MGAHVGTESNVESNNLTTGPDIRMIPAIFEGLLSKSYHRNLATMMDYESIAELLRTSSGQWVEIRRDKHNRIYALLSKWRRSPPAAFRSGRFEFTAAGCGYRSGETRLMIRHVPVTFPA